jgi:stage III sporulation protein AE
MDARKCLWAVCLLILLLFAAPEMSLAAEEENGLENVTGEMGIEDELKEMQRFLDEIMRQQGNGGKLTFVTLMKELAAGNIKGILKEIGAGLQNQLYAEISQSGKLLAQVAVIGVLGAVFSNISSVFQKSQIADVGFFAAYLLMFTCLAGSFLTSLAVAAGLLEEILEFVRLLMPAYFMAVAFSGGSASALALYEGMMAAVAAVEWLCGRFLLPGVKLYVLLILGSHVVKEPLLTRAAKLLEKCVGWSLKTLLGLVVGLQFLQSMILPYADSVGRRGIWQFVKMIPGLGQGAGAAAQMVLGAGVLVKNAIGGAAMVVLAVISLLPVIKLTVLMVMYHLAAAVMQPVCDRRMVSCVAGAARGQELLLQIVLYALFVFILAVAITCVSTNTGYLAA